MTDDVNNQKGLELLNVFPQEEVDLAIERLENNYELRSNYSKLWLVTREIAKKRAIFTSDSLDVYYGGEEKTNEAVLWNANLRKCGIDGFVDHNTKTIHENEPTQGVVFTGTALRRILVIPQILKKPLPDINKIPVHQIENLLKNKNLFNSDIEKFLDDAENKDEIARIIIQYKPELSDKNVFTLLAYAENKDEIARILGSDNINKLDIDSVFHLLKDANEKEKMAEILGKANIDKLTDWYVFNLLYYTKNKGQMARILGPENINKLSDDDVENLLSRGSESDRGVMRQILRKYYTGTNQEVISLLNQ